MKKIGILFGKENTFPQAFIDRVNQKNVKGISAEAVSIEMVQQAKPTEYAVIIDRISQDVPFYRSYLKNAAICGTAVINNPFWWSADEKFVNNAIAEQVGVAVPKTVILPSNHRPDDTDENSFRNLKIMDWDSIFDYIGFPAYMKPHAGGGWKSVYRVENPDDLFAKHRETEQLVMMLQEEIQFTEYFRCYYLGGDRVHIMQYEPRNPHHLRYLQDAPPVDKAIMDKVHEGVLKLNHALGYDFNTVEFAVRDGVPYAIDFCNPAPDADIHSVGEDNFEWIVENAANLAIERAQAQKPGKMNLTWGNFVKDQMSGATPKPKMTKPAAEKTTATKKPSPATKPKPATKATPAAKPAPATPTAKKKATTSAKNPTATAKKSTTKQPAAPKKSVETKRGKADTRAKRMMAQSTEAAKPAPKKTATPKKKAPTKGSTKKA